MLILFEGLLGTHLVPISSVLRTLLGGNLSLSTGTITRLEIAPTVSLLNPGALANDLFRVFYVVIVDVAQ